MEIALMFLKSLPVLLLAFLCWPFTLGVALGVKRHTDRYIIGFAAMQALFFIIYIPAILFGWSTRTLSITAAAVITVAGVAGTLIRYFTSDNKQEIFRVNKPDPKFFKNPYFMWVHASPTGSVGGFSVLWRISMNSSPVMVSCS